MSMMIRFLVLLEQAKLRFAGELGLVLPGLSLLLLAALIVAAVELLLIDLANQAVDHVLKLLLDMTLGKLHRLARIRFGQAILDVCHRLENVLVGPVVNDGIELLELLADLRGIVDQLSL